MPLQKQNSEIHLRNKIIFLFLIFCFILKIEGKFKPGPPLRLADDPAEVEVSQDLDETPLLGDPNPPTTTQASAPVTVGTPSTTPTTTTIIPTTSTTTTTTTPTPTAATTASSPVFSFDNAAGFKPSVSIPMLPVAKEEKKTYASPSKVSKATKDGDQQNFSFQDGAGFTPTAPIRRSSYGAYQPDLASRKNSIAVAATKKPAAPTALPRTAWQGSNVLRLAQEVLSHRNLSGSFGSLAQTQGPIWQAVQDIMKNNMTRTERFLESVLGTQLSFPPMTLIFLRPTLSWPLSDSAGMSTRMQFAFQWFFPIEDPLADLGPALGLSRRKRDLEADESDEDENVVRHGNEDVERAPENRYAFYKMLETMIDTITGNGKECVLRAICETQEEPLYGHGFFGEIIEMLLSPSLSEDPSSSSTMNQYLEAEITGLDEKDCSAYKHKCHFSIYTEVEKSKWF